MNSKGKVVWIVYLYYNYDEGYSSPQAVFDSYDKAEQYVKKVKQYVKKIKDEYESWEIESFEVG